MARSSTAREQLEGLLRTPDRGARVVLEGPAGIGKTTLVQNALASVTPDRVRVVVQRASSSGGHEPFAAVSSLVAPDAQDPLSAAYARVDDWCAWSPLVLWVDDAQNADPGSLAVLGRLWSATPLLPLIVILTMRPGPCRVELAGLVELASHRLTVDPLSDAEMAAVVRARTGAMPGPVLRVQLQVAAGNPFVLGVLLSLLQRRGSIQLREGQAEVIAADVDVPASARAAVRAYLSQLSPRSTELAATVAALGSPADLLEVAAMMRSPLAGLQRSVSEAGEFGVLDWRGDAVALRHEIYGEVLLDDLSAPLQAALHRDAVRVLRQRDAPDVRVAAQVMRSRDRDDGELLRSLAASTVRVAPGVAADLLDYVSAHTGPEDPGPLAVERATALFLAGRGRDAEDLVHITLPRTGDREARSQLRALAHRSMVNRANTGAALAEVDNLLTSPGLPPRSGLVLREARAWVLLLAGMPALAEAACANATSFAATAGLTGQSELFVTTRACLAFLRARPGDALRLLPTGQLRQVVDQISIEPTVTAWPPLFALFAHGCDAAREAGKAARTISAAQGGEWLTALHDWVSAVVDWHSGNWDDAVAAVDAGLERARESGTGWTSLAVGIRALIRVHTGELSAARTELADFDRRGLPVLFGLDYPGLAGLAAAEAAAVAAYQAAPSETTWRRAQQPVQERAATLWQTATASGGQLWLLLLGPYVARIGDEALRAEVANAVAGAELSPTYGLTVVGQHLLGLAREDHDVVAEAATQLAGLGLIREAAFGFEEAGLLAARQGDPTASGSELRLAVDHYTRLGATTDLERLRARAHRLGVRIGTGPPRRRATTGWGALTATERTVAGLVRQGMTNPAIAQQLYVSPRTVQTHVSHILAKTGLRSRVDIATEFVT